MSELTKISVNKVKEAAQNKDVLLDNDFLAISNYIGVSDEDIERLKKWQIEEVYLQDSNVSIVEESVDFDKFLREYKVFKNIYFNIVKKTKNNLGNYKNNNIVNIAELNEIIDDLFDLIGRNLNSVIQLLNLYNLKNEDEYYIRSLNVALISVLIGREMNLNDSNLKKLAMGGILYDIGLTKVPEKIIKKNTKFTTEEYNEIKKHTVYGYKIMKSNFRCEEDVAAISLEHHEFFNGTGYPRGISGNQIHSYAKIVAVAHAIEKKLKYTRILYYDKFNNSYNRSPKAGSLFSDAIRHVIQGANIKYDPNISKILVSIFSVYPIGTVVILNDKRKGLVFSTNRKFPLKPIIKIVADENYNIVEDGDVINLSENTSLFISGIEKNIVFLEEVNKKILNDSQEIC